MMGSFGCASRSSPLFLLPEMRLGQIGCGRQNPPVQSAELASSRIGMAKGMPSTSLQDWKAATRSIASLETQVVRHRWISVYIDLHEAAALRPWMLVPESLVALAAEVRLTYISVSQKQ
ncbi:Hypothetical_protein [Hexamita inflata]|uniref:Hypothetical_protein n=1 Tax=Hexamita inflata TaxID=28002 RepID=A0AA86R688_9EUKA|nr:Hypothetical protein HINF_LOCUS13195 [Hexamita inflata]CAI9966694.1 Hypothetical protein HINF_LOCUS54339 [Hexamita inflata]